MLQAGDENMELAVVGDGPARVRLKLHFEDISILTAEQVQEGLSDSWYLLGCHLRSIADLASHIVVAFGLLNSCPHGISLHMENFTLPPSQPIWLLKDKDVVSVSKKKFSINAGDPLVKHACSSSLGTLEKIAPNGVKTCALEEFEREIGGYESEEEEEEDAREALRKDVGDKALRASSTKSKQKKRKRVKMERADEQGLMKLQVVPYTGGLTGDKERKKHPKRQKLIMQQDDNEKLHQADETEEGRKCEKGQEPESSKAIKTEKKKKDKAMTSKADESIEEPTVEKQQGLKGSNKNVSLSTSDSSSDEKVQDEKKKPGLHVEGESGKKCSRSTLRKKAKRRWKRENGGLAHLTLQSDKLGDGPVKVLALKDAAEELSLAFPFKHKDDGDAEEERLPLVVRPGHLRFEPLDEDDDDGFHSQHPLPLLGWGNGISKRKGQSWGQEKPKRGGRNFEAVDNMEICDNQELKLETLPALEGTPQNGDVIAYRILELTAFSCPELSEYRVGKVVALDGHSGTIKLTEVPEYPLRRRHDDHEAETNGDISVSSLYDDEGFLETQISSLADIRLVERGPHETCKITSTIQAPTDLATTDINTILNTSTADTEVDASKTSTINPNSSKANLPTEGQSSAPLQGWLEITEELERKKEELGKKEGITATRAVEVDTTKIGNGCSSAVSNSKNASTGRAKGWHKKAGGLGSTMALLRSQNVL
eukprot:c24342_g1_i1 orf=70-2202(-)